MRKLFTTTVATLVVLAVTASARQDPAATADIVTERSVRAHMEFLASDALNGRAGGTRDEWIAAEYIGSRLRAWGFEPLADGDTYVQTITAAATADTTHNAIGMLRGADPSRAEEVILLSAHLDHLGNRGTGDDTIYNGADDDASGCVAVLELAEALAKGPRPQRSVMVAFFGREETSGLGAQWFIEHPPVPLERIVANLEFEMIGRPDPMLEPHQLWMTGYERTNLGRELAAHGAAIVADPRPEQNFFRRSDNYALARRGIVAHAISSFGLHPQYHRPNDDLDHIDFEHMTAAIRSLMGPMLWLANAEFKPDWLPGMRPMLGTSRNWRDYAAQLALGVVRRRDRAAGGRHQRPASGHRPGHPDVLRR